MLPHHLGMNGYGAKKKKWREEEREATVAGLENRFKGIDERERGYINARRPKKLKEGRTKYNEPWTGEAEKALRATKAAKEHGLFEPC